MRGSRGGGGVFSDGEGSGYSSEGKSECLLLPLVVPSSLLSGRLEEQTEAVEYAIRYRLMRSARCFDRSDSLVHTQLRLLSHLEPRLVHDRRHPLGPRREKLLKTAIIRRDQNRYRLYIHSGYKQHRFNQILTVCREAGPIGQFGCSPCRARAGRHMSHVDVKSMKPGPSAILADGPMRGGQRRVDILLRAIPGRWKVHFEIDKNHSMF